MKGLFNYETAYRVYTRLCLDDFVKDNILRIIKHLSRLPLHLQHILGQRRVLFNLSQAAPLSKTKLKCQQPGLLPKTLMTHMSLKQSR